MLRPHLDVILFYYYIDNFFILFHKISICTGVIMQRLDSFIEVQMLWPHCDVRITLSLYLLDLPMHRCYSAEAVIYLFSIWDGMQHSIPKVWQVVPSNISVQSRIVHSYVMASLTALAILQPSLPMILKFSTDVVWPVLFWCSNIGDGAFKCSLYLSTNILDDSPMYSSSPSILSHLNQ